jgi:hypothetical protein
MASENANDGDSFELAPVGENRFEGIYTSDEVDGTYAIVSRDDRLAIQVPTRPEIRSCPCSSTRSAAACSAW